MRSIPSLLACALFISILPARFAGAQSVHTAFGNRAANTPEDLQRAITRFPYTWEIPDGKTSVTFNSDGTGRQTFFSFTWRIKDAQQIELTLAGGTNKAEIRFSADYTSYTGADFNGSGLHGSVVMPQAAPAQVPSQPAATTPAQAGGNSFFDSLTTRQNPGSDNGGIEKAIVNSHYSWEHETGTNLETVSFAPDGTGRQTFFDITWRIKGPHELEIAIPSKKEEGKIVLRFNGDFTKYTATDFDGESSLRGHKIVEK